MFIKVLVNGSYTNIVTRFNVEVRFDQYKFLHPFDNPQRQERKDVFKFKVIV